MEYGGFEQFCLPLYVINLPERTDRLIHIQEQFKGRDEFDLTIVEAHKHSIGAIGLWESIKRVVRLALERDEDVIIICEDDHIFTPHYSKKQLFAHIVEAADQGANLMLGGISYFHQAVPIAQGRFWIDRFHGAQFTIIYKKFFLKILDEKFDCNDAADLKLSEMTSHKMVIYPFISVQKDFGYSDIPIQGLETSEYHKLFKMTENKISIIHEKAKQYLNLV